MLCRKPIVRDRPGGEYHLPAQRWHQPARDVRRDTRDRGEPALTSEALRRWMSRSLGDQRGSTLVMGLMLVFIMTLLGAALFNVAQLDARLKLDSQTGVRSEEHTSELQSPCNLVCRLLLEKK